LFKKKLKKNSSNNEMQVQFSAEQKVAQQNIETINKKEKRNNIKIQSVKLIESFSPLKNNPNFTSILEEV
jgi:hypothetical protein